MLKWMHTCDIGVHPYWVYGQTKIEFQDLSQSDMDYLEKSFEPFKHIIQSKFFTIN
jgi:hypothetical protein